MSLKLVSVFHVFVLRHENHIKFFLFLFFFLKHDNSGAMSRDISHEAKILVKRMRSDPNVDVQRHWKLVTILIGPNDFCSDFCYLPYPEKSIENHRRELIETLRILQENLPRTIVNLVTPPSECKI